MAQDPLAWLPDRATPPPAPPAPTSALSWLPDQAPPVDDRSFIGKAADLLIPTALRVTGGIGGGIVGGMAGVAAGGIGALPGAALGGAAGAGLGEGLAEAYEVWRGQRDRINPTQMATQAAFGMIPGAAPLKAGASATRVLATRAAQGAVLGGSANVAASLADDQPLTMGGVARDAAMGAVAGGAFGIPEARAAARRPAPVAAPPPALETPAPRTPDQKFEDLRVKQNTAPQKPNLLERALTEVQDARRHFVDQFAPVSSLMKAGGLDPVTTPVEQNPVKRIELATGGVAGKVQAEAIQLERLLAEAKDAGLEKPFNDYLNLVAMEHGAETLSRRQMTEKLETGRALPETLTPTDLAAKRQQWATRTDLAPDAKAAVEALTAKVLASNRDAFETYAAAGLAKPETVARIRERNAEGSYIPLTREMDEIESAFVTSGNLDMPTQKYLQTLNGSSRTTEHPLVATLRKRAIAVQEAERNLAMRTLVDLRKTNETFAAAITPLKPDEPPPAGKGFITVFEEGVPQRYAVPEDVANALKSSEPTTANILVKTLQGVGHVFRTGTTVANVPFAFGNLPKDVGDFGVLAGKSRLAGIANPKLWAEWGRAWKQAVTESPEYLDFLRSGAAFSTFQKNLSEAQSFLKIAQGASSPLQSAGRVFASPITAAKWLNNSVEEATKLMAFQHYQGKGMSVDEAAWHTRRFGGSPDFARRGASMKAMNTVFPFLNAQVQALARLGAAIKNNPERLATAAGAVLGKLVLLHLWNRSFTDPDGTKSWDRITAREKQGNWIFLIPGTFTDPETGAVRQNYVKIPAGHAVDLIRAPFMAMLDEQTRNPLDVTNAIIGGLPTSPEIRGGVPQSIADTVVSSANPLIRVPAEQMMNRDTFRNTPLESPRLQGVSAAERFTDMTSPTAKKIGGALGWSPQRIEHAVRGTTGGVGTTILGTLDSLQERSTRKAVTEIPGLKQVSELPIVGGVTRQVVQKFVGGPASLDAIANKKKETFYATLKQAEQLNNTKNLFRQRIQTATATGNTRAAAEAQSKLQALASNPRQRALINMSGWLNRISQQLAALRRVKNYTTEKQVLDAIDAALKDLPEE